MDRKIDLGFVGIGVVGHALSEAYIKKGFNVYRYDKYKKQYINFIEVLNCDVIFLCLPTLTINGKQDLSAFIEYLPRLKDYKGLIVIKSTVLPGTTQILSNMYNLNIIHSPEFLTLEHASHDALNPDRIVVGYDKFQDKGLMYKLFSCFNCPIVFTNIITSELIKYACNCELAMQVSYANELFDIANTIGAAYEDVKKAMLLDERIGKFKHVTLKRGYGGMCFPKDTEAFISMFNSKMVKATIKVNDEVRK